MMAARRKGVMAYIDRAIDGADSTTDDSDGDDEHSTRKLTHELDTRTTMLPETPDPDDASDHSRTASPSRKRRLPSPDEAPTKIELSTDDELDVLPRRQTKKPKVSKPRGVAVGRLPTAEKRKTKEKSIVGRRDQVIRARPLQRAVAMSTNVADMDDDDDDKLEAEQPEYLKRRRAVFNKAQERLKEAGLRLPPNFNDIEFSDDERLDELQERPRFKKTPSNPYEDKDLPASAGIIPAPVAQWLRPYQVEGAAFLHKLFVYQKGGILGDDMGLGKTIQVIAFLMAAFGKTGDERDAKRMRRTRRAKGDRWYPRVLIICPAGLINNWESELETWAWFHVEKFHGTSNKQSIIESISNGRVEIVITSYHTYKTWSSQLNLVEWDCVIADEVHLIKRYNAETTKAMDVINSMCRIGLTGTAIQNKYEELWTLLNWANPGRLGLLKSWRTSICIPLKLGQSHDATKQQLALARTTAKKLAHNLLPRFFLRRTKKLIADELPKKTDRVVFCPLTESQAEAYENFLESEVVELIRTSTELCDCDSGKKRGWCCYQYLPDGMRWQTRVFPAILTCQTIANHLATLIPRDNDPTDKQARDLEALQTAMPAQWRHLNGTREWITHMANQDFCGKWRVLKKLLEFWYAAGDKVLVFSHSVRLLRMLHQLFVATTAYSVSYLDGGMPFEARTTIVNEFNASEDTFVFLISTRAGGVGLNITAANKVVVVDPNWNPAHDLQAQDRAYRIGQRRDVDVFRLVSAGTIEEIVYARQIYKQQQASIALAASTERRYFRGVQDRAAQKGEIFGLANMFGFRREGLILRDIVNQTNIAESRAGVEVVGLDVDAHQDDDDDIDSTEHHHHAAGTSAEDENPDAAIAALAQLISQGSSDSSAFDAAAAAPGPPPRTSSTPTTAPPSGRARASAVSAILARAGVTYSHNNAEVLGSSAVETRLSRRAVETADGGGGAVFRNRSPTHNRIRTHAGDAIITAAAADDDDESDAAARAGATIRRYNPPAEVRTRQFGAMAAAFCGGDVRRFALLVEGVSAAERRGLLDRFYRGARGELVERGVGAGGAGAGAGAGAGSRGAGGDRSHRAGEGAELGG